MLSKPRLIVGEAPSSFVVRLSVSTTIKPLSLPSVLLNERIQGDVDCVSTDVYARLLAACGYRKTADVLQWRMGAINSVFGGRHPSRRPWVAFTKRGGRRAFQICPECVSEDVIPHYRLVWRLPFQSVCTVHNKRLIDACPNCGEIINLDRMIRSVTPENEIRRCAICRQRFQRTSTDAAHPLAISFHRLQNDAITTGSFSLADGRPYFSPLLFAGLEQLFAAMSEKCYGRKLLQTISEFVVGFDPQLSASAKNDLATVETTVGHNLAIGFGFLLQDWPSNFEAVFDNAGISSLSIQRSLPFFLQYALDNLKRQCRRPDNCEVDRCLDWMAKQGMPIRLRRVMRFSGWTAKVAKDGITRFEKTHDPSRKNLEKISRCEAIKAPWQVTHEEFELIRHLLPPGLYLRGWTRRSESSALEILDALVWCSFGSSLFDLPFKAPPRRELNIRRRELRRDGRLIEIFTTLNEHRKGTGRSTIPLNTHYKAPMRKLMATILRILQESPTLLDRRGITEQLLNFRDVSEGVSYERLLRRVSINLAAAKLKGRVVFSFSPQPHWAIAT